MAHTRKQLETFGKKITLENSKTEIRKKEIFKGMRAKFLKEGENINTNY